MAKHRVRSSHTQHAVNAIIAAVALAGLLFAGAIAYARSDNATRERERVANGGCSSVVLCGQWTEKGPQLAALK